MTPVTREELKQLILKALDLAAPQQFSAGELTTVLNDAGTDVTKYAVKQALEVLRGRGECTGIKATFYRNGANRTGMAYTAKRTSEQNQASAIDKNEKDPFARFA